VPTAESIPLSDYIAQKVGRLCDAAQMHTERGEIIATLRSLFQPWGHKPLAHLSSWASEISDDNTPVEFSVAIAGDKVELRVLFEPQGDAPTLSAQRTAGLALHDRLVQEFGVDDGMFRRVQDLFLGGTIEGAFSVWSSVVFARGKRPLFKTYLNPQAHGRALAPALVEEALGRLGIHGAWASLSKAAARRGPYLDEIKYFALDLLPDQARVKVYVHHHGASSAELEAACEASTNYVPGRASGFARAMLGGEDATMSPRAPFTCHAFRREHSPRPVTTVYVPACAYARHDEAVRERVSTYLESRTLDTTAYNTLVKGFADRPLESGVGMQSWVALRDDAAEARVTLYLATEARLVHAPGSVPAPTAAPLRFASAEEVVRSTAGMALDQHPLMRRIARDMDGEALWLLIHNLYEGTSKQFSRWLAHVTALAPDEAIRSLLARQLSQELGEGDLARSHGVLIRRFLQGLEGLKPRGFSEADLEPGRRLARRLAQHYLSADPHECLATLMAGEVAAHQVIQFVNGMLKRIPRPMEASTLEWLRLHDEVEGDHAEESFLLARQLPAEAPVITAVSRGAVGLHQALWTLFDELYPSADNAVHSTVSAAGVTYHAAG
jgi:DMATS type aromatic prenyltransferase